MCLRPVLPLLVVSLLLAVPGAEAAEVPAAHVLEGWRYRWGDGPIGEDGVPTWAKESGEGEGWLPMSALGTPEGRDEQCLLWISIPLPQGDWEHPSLYLGAVANVFELYSDGVLRYRSGELDPEGYETAAHADSHLVRLPAKALGKRVLLRIQSSGASIGVRQDVQLGEQDALFKRAVGRSMGPFVLGVVLLALGTLSALGFVARARDRQLGALALFALSTGAIATFMSGAPHALWDVGRTGYLVMLVGVFFGAPSLWSFVDATILEGRRRWFTWAGRGFLGGAGLLSLLTLTVHGALPHVFPLYMMSIVVSVLALVAITWQEARRGNADARIFAAGLLALFLACVVSALSSFAVLQSIGFVLHWGLLGLTLSLLGILARRTQEVVRTLEAQTRSLTQGQEKVQSLAGRMRNGATELLAVVQQLRTSAANQNEGVSRQAAALQQAQETVDELRQTSRLTAEKSRQVAASATEADEAGRVGTEALEATMSSLEEIRAEVGEMAQRIRGLDAHTREIAGIVETVKGLADQSNMLALNAAIEAVRSGEHGKGFGVVAREVRSLADQSIEATARIREILATLSSSTREVAELSRSGEERVRSSLDEVRASGNQLRRLATLVQETGGTMRTITAAVAQQDVGTNQIAAAVGDLSAQMQRTLQSVQQTEEVSRSVQRLAEGLSEGVVATPAGGVR